MSGSTDTGPPIPFDTPEGLAKSLASDKGLKQRILHTLKEGSMPKKGSRMNATEIERVEKYLDEILTDRPGQRH